MKKILKLLLAVLLVPAVIVAGIMISNRLKVPTHDRDWSDESAVLPDLTVSSTTVSVKNLRDWRYGTHAVVSRDYYDDSFALDKASKAYLLFNPFGKWEGVGHSFFVFEFDDGKTVSVSIEARSQKGESYDAIRGIFNNYELWYVFGSPADLMSRRAIFHQEDLYLYELKIPRDGVRALFSDLATAAQHLETEPAFYNTVSSNCTNLLADSANRVKKGSVPFHYSRLFTGYADDQLYDLGLIRNDVPFTQVFAEARLDEEIRQAFGGRAEYSKEEYWKSVLQF